MLVKGHAGGWNANTFYKTFSTASIYHLAIIHWESRTVVHSLHPLQWRNRCCCNMILEKFRSPTSILGEFQSNTKAKRTHPKTQNMFSTHVLLFVFILLYLYTLLHLYTPVITLSSVRCLIQKTTGSLLSLDPLKDFSMCHFTVISGLLIR